MTTAGVAVSHAVPRTTARRHAPTPQQRAAMAARAAKARFNRTMLKVMGCVLMVCLFVYITRMAVIASGSKNIEGLRNEITALENNQQYLNIQLTARANPQRVYDEAVNRLGMGYPDESRVNMVVLPGYYSADVQTAEARDFVMP